MENYNRILFKASLLKDGNVNFGAAGVGTNLIWTDQKKEHLKYAIPPYDPNNYTFKQIQNDSKYEKNAMNIIRLFDKYATNKPEVDKEGNKLKADTLSDVQKANFLRDIKYHQVNKIGTVPKDLMGIGNYNKIIKDPVLADQSRAAADRNTQEVRFNYFGYEVKDFGCSTDKEGYQDGITTEGFGSSSPKKKNIFQGPPKNSDTQTRASDA